MQIFLKNLKAVEFKWLWEKYKTSKFKWLIAGLAFILGLFFLYYFLTISIDMNALEKASQRSEIIRNLAWLFWMVVSIAGLLAGLHLRQHGWQIQQEQSNAQQRQSKTQENSVSHEPYAKAVAMLGDDLMTGRIAGCRSLADLAVYNNSMYSLCARSLLSYIKEPKSDDNSLTDHFDAGMPLREDILVAISSVLAIYRDAYKQKEKVDGEVIFFPHYFWKDEKRALFIFLIAIFQVKICKMQN